MIRRHRLVLLLPVILALTCLFPTLEIAGSGENGELMSRAEETGYAKIIVKLDVKDIDRLTKRSTQYKTIEPGQRVRTGMLQADLALESAVHASANAVLHRLNGKDYRLNHMFNTLPYVALDVSPEVLALLPTFPEVLHIYEDRPHRLVPPAEPTGTADPMLSTSTVIVGADTAWAMGYTGSGWHVAVLDTGIRRTHQFFQGKSIVEACFSKNSDCPNDRTEMYGTGSAAHYSSAYYGHDHGTHVAGIATGDNGSFSGVAKDGNIIAVQIFSRFSAEECDGNACVMSYDSDQVKGLEYVYSLRGTYSIAAVNMSLGAGAYGSYCNSDPQKVAIDNLKSVRIATAVATGNDGYCGYISSPACISSAVAVGASSSEDTEAYFNNWHDSLQELFAPGVSIYSATGDSDSSYESWGGTSMATPHVAGAWALLREAAPSASVDTILNALRTTGYNIATLCWSGGSCPRIQVDSAISELGGSQTPSLTVTSPNGGESWKTGSTHNITWTSTGSVGSVKISYSTNNGSNWTTITSSTSNDGAYPWTLPSKTSSQCLVRVNEASDGSPSDSSNAVFSIFVSSTTPPAITVTAPNGGESWDAGSVHNIEWTSAGTVGDVKISYSVNDGANWTTVISSTDNDGTYSWTLPSQDSDRCLVRINEASDGSPSDTSDAVFAIAVPEPPEIALSRSSFNFGGIAGGIATDSQRLRIDNSGGGNLQWAAIPSASWLNCYPSSGGGFETTSISVSAAGLSPGTYTSTITFAGDAENSPQYVAVTLNVKSASNDEPPFGTLSTPVNGTVVSGSIPVTGWVLDDIEVESVKIYRGFGNQKTYVGDALLVDGARTDIESLYSGYPLSYRAGFGYMLLSYFLPDGGNGSYTFSAVAVDKGGQTVTLGTTTVTCNNSASARPFGAIDTPVAGGEVSGGSYRNGGWVLTPLPNKIPEDGSSIRVYVDGMYLGHPVYNIYRADIAGFFPGYANSGGAHGYFDIDTTAFANGIHTIAWTVVDNAGNSEGIGSRYFTILNGSGNRSLGRVSGGGIPVDYSGPVGVLKGFGDNVKPHNIYPDIKGNITVRIRELERVAFRLSPGVRSVRMLPPGSVLDVEGGIFYWHPGPGFLGNYDLEFVTTGVEGKPVKKKLRVVIGPRF